MSHHNRAPPAISTTAGLSTILFFQRQLGSKKRGLLCLNASYAPAVYVTNDVQLLLQSLSWPSPTTLVQCSSPTSSVPSYPYTLLPESSLSLERGLLSLPLSLVKLAVSCSPNSSVCYWMTRVTVELNICSRYKVHFMCRCSNYIVLGTTPNAKQ